MLRASDIQRLPGGVAQVPGCKVWQVLENPITRTSHQGPCFLPTCEAERSLITAPSSSLLLTPTKRRFEGPGARSRQAAGWGGGDLGADALCSDQLPMKLSQEHKPEEGRERRTYWPKTHTFQNRDARLCQPSRLLVTEMRESRHHLGQRGTDTGFFADRTLWIPALKEIDRWRLGCTGEFCPPPPRLREARFHGLRARRGHPGARGVSHSRCLAGAKGACLSLSLSSVFTTKLQEHIVLQDREELGPMDARELVLKLIIRLAPNVGEWHGSTCMWIFKNKCGTVP